MIVDIFRKQKLRWMILCYKKATNGLIGRVGSFQKNGSVLTLLHCYEYL